MSIYCKVTVRLVPFVLSILTFQLNRKKIAFVIFLHLMFLKLFRNKKGKSVQRLTWILMVNFTFWVIHLLSLVNLSRCWSEAMRSLNLNALQFHGLTVTVDTNLGKPVFPVKAPVAGIFILAELLVSMETLWAPWRSSVQIEKNEDNYSSA